MSNRAEYQMVGESASRIQVSSVTWLLAAILALALGLRLWGIGFGLPYELTPDEAHEIHRALKLGAGEYYWEFGKGGLYYILFVEYGLLYAIWWITGRVGATHDFALEIIRDPSMLYLLGRVTVAVMGALTCVVVFNIGKRLYDLRIAFVAALIGATAFTHVAHSHIINVDVGMTLAAWIAFLAYLEYERSGNQRWLVWSGALAGIAIAFKLTGGIILLVLFLAIASRTDNWRHISRMAREGAVVLAAMLAALTIVAPEWIESFTSGRLFGSVFYMFAGSLASAQPFQGQTEDAVSLVTIFRRSEQTGTGYIEALIEPYNLPLTVAALSSIYLGIVRRQRWSIIWSVVIAVFLIMMTAALRSPNEYYLLPIVPALWLLGGQAIVRLAGRHRSLLAGGVACITIVPLVAIVRQNVERTKPDTRLIAKDWIEANIGSGSKILMDGYQHRFVPSPPLRPDKSAIQRQVAGVLEDGHDYRGVSSRTLTLYAEAMSSIDGPTYELHSTQWGLAVQDPTYYAQLCFDYIITSSSIAKRYEDPINQQRFPKSSRFYEQLEGDSRFRKIYSLKPIPWQRPGPTIDIYKVVANCGER